jgi:hypothetical protein
MRFSEIILETQTQLDSLSGRKFTEAQVGLAVNSQQRSCIRYLADKDEAYFNHTFTLLKAAARTPHANLWSWRLPLWVMKVSSVRQYLGGSTSTRGVMLHRLTKYDELMTSGWRWTASNELVLVGYGQAIDLELEVAKIPARMTKGTLPSQAGLTTSQMKLDADAGAVHVHESVLDSYAGGLFEITGPASTRLGQLLRCIGSGNDPAGRILTMEEAWTSVPVVADTYEMHMELPTQHGRLLVLLATRQLLAQEKNLEGVNAIRDEIAEQWRQFTDTIGNRDLTQPYTVIEDLMPDPNRWRDSTYIGDYL